MTQPTDEEIQAALACEREQRVAAEVERLEKLELLRDFSRRAHAGAWITQLEQSEALAALIDLFLQ